MSARKYTGYYTYRVWLAYMNHFTKENFSVLKYPAAQCHLTTYEKSRLKYLFEWLSERYSADKMKSVMLANFVQGFWGVEESDMFWMTSRERTNRAWKQWAQRMRHFNYYLRETDIPNGAFNCDDPDERFHLFRKMKISPEAYLIANRKMMGCELDFINEKYGQEDSFPNYAPQVLFLRKYDLLLEKIPPVREFLLEQGI